MGTCRAGAGAVRAPVDASIEVIDSVDTVSPDEWNRLLEPGDIQSSHAFVRTWSRAAAGATRMWHVLVRRGGTLIGIASVCAMEVRLDLLATGAVGSAIRSIRGVLPSLLRIPILFCGPPVSFGNAGVRYGDPDDATFVLEAVSRTMEEMADELGIEILAFKELGQEEERRAAILLRSGYFTAPSLPACCMEVPWSSFDEYQSGMRAGYRRRLAKLLRAREESGLRFRIEEDFSAECDRIFALYGRVMDRAPFQLERLNREFFEELNANMGSSARALLGEVDGEVVTAGILLYAPGVLTFLVAGIDYERNVQCQAYLNLVTEVVAEAIRTGARSLHLGQTSYELKLRMGARVSPRVLFLRHRTPWKHSVFEGCRRWLFPTTTPPSRRIFRETGA